MEGQGKYQSESLTPTDIVHTAFLAQGRQRAVMQIGEFGDWARTAQDDPEPVVRQIQESYGRLPVQEAWSAFAPIYNEDSPDHLLGSACNFVGYKFLTEGIDSSRDRIASVDTRAGGAARNFADQGFEDILAFDKSAPMIAAARKLSGIDPHIHLMQADLSTVKLNEPVRAMAWLDYGANFALTPQVLGEQVQNLLSNLQPKGCLVFDVRTVQGWSEDQRHKRLSVVSSDHFKRITVTERDFENRTVRFDRYIRAQTGEGGWDQWRHEQLQERMWTIPEIKDILSELDCTLEGVYGDDFTPVPDSQEPNLAYFVVKKGSNR